MRWLALPLALRAFLVLPVLAIFLDSPPGELLDALGEPGALDALWLSLRTSVTALAIIVVIGTPAAYLLATRRFRGRALVITLIELPLVLPPAVAGIALLAAVGPSGSSAGRSRTPAVQLTFETAGVVVALTFVARRTTCARRRPRSERSTAAGSTPRARSALAGAHVRARRDPDRDARAVTGGALAFGRALGEFGATLMFAGSLAGITQTAPLAIYERFATDFEGALALSAVLVAVSAVILLSVKLVEGAAFRHG